MRGLRRIRSVQPPKSEGPARPTSLRDRLAVVLALVTVVCLGSVFFLANGKTFLMPGPLTSAHGAIKNCSSCHTRSGSGKLSWIHGLVAGDPHADSKACLTCHKMPDTAFNAHSASADALKQSTERLSKIAAASPVPRSARAQSIAFPTHDMVARGLYCATCHQEHQGANFKLNKLSNEQCQSCHVVKFDSFDGNHPKFENYPFKRRTRIVYDHAAHFGKHYPEVAKKYPAKRIPATCSTCHNSRDDKRIMAVAPFEQTCSACHLDQISGKERVSGPKGVAFLSLPGLDLQSLKKKNAAIGEWPEASDAALTPFMKVMISRNEQGRALIKTVDSLDLQDLANASDDQIKAVTKLVWEIKTLFYKLISGKASDVLGDLNIGGGAKLSANLVADLTASIPRDVVISAQKQWLPALATEMAKGPTASEQQQGGWNAVVTEPAATQTEAPGPESPEETPDQDAEQEAREPDSPAAASKEANTVKLDPPACLVRVLGQCLVSKGPEATAAKSEGAAEEPDTANPEPDGGTEKSDGGTEKSSVKELPPAMQAGLKELAQAAQPEAAAGKNEPANAKPEGGKETPSASKQSQGKATEQSDELLFPTAEELREIKARNKDAGNVALPAEAPAGAAAISNTAPANTQTMAAPVISIESDVDPENWAEYGGWYQQDYAIFYRPAGHKDKFIYSWLTLTGPQAPKGDRSPPAAVFDFLTNKDAQGSCTKCHSVDDIQGKGRIVNFSPLSVEKKQGQFTRFIHEPHFGIVGDRGCLTCHNLEKGRPYLKSYEQSNPHNFASEFSEVKKDRCQSCHTSSMARQDCLLCHKYHVNDVITPITNTKLPTQ